MIRHLLLLALCTPVLALGQQQVMIADALTLNTAPSVRKTASPGTRRRRTSEPATG